MWPPLEVWKILLETRFPHLASIDAETWPGVTKVPTTPFMALRARQAEARFARACTNAGLSVSGQSPDITVDHEQLFPRLAVSGWLGLAESYMAGEWHAGKLADVLTSLLATGYRPRGRYNSALRLPATPADSGGALPAELIRLSSGDGMSSFGGIFASGVPTTVRTAVRSHAHGAGRNREPATHFVDVTTIAEPVAVERADLGEAQRRAASLLLDAAKVRAGSHLLELPSSGGAVAILAAKRGATVDSLTADAEQLRSITELFILAGVEDDVHAALIPQAIPSSRDVRGTFDAIVSMEKLEVVGESGRKKLLGVLDQHVATGGHAALQSLVATKQFGPTAADAVAMLRAYIWPALDYPSVEEVHRVVDRESSLRVVGQTHFPQHYLTSIQLQRELFEGQLREAAADGFDVVFRRMWVFHFALIEALLRLGCLDAVQFSVTTRNRRGRR